MSNLKRQLVQYLKLNHIHLDLWNNPNADAIANDWADDVLKLMPFEQIREKAVYLSQCPIELHDRLTLANDILSLLPEPEPKAELRYKVKELLWKLFYDIRDNGSYCHLKGVEEYTDRIMAAIEGGDGDG